MAGVELQLLGPDPCINEACHQQAEHTAVPLCAAPCRPRTSLPIVSRPQIKRELISQLAQALVPLLTDQLCASSLKPGLSAVRLSRTATAA